MKPTWESDCGTVKLWLGDCLDVLPTIETGSVDAIIDPPYGLAEKWKGGCWQQARNGRGKLWDNTIPEWDLVPAENEVQATIAASSTAIVWGGNYFHLPPTTGWLIWDKVQKFSGSDAELAWSNLRIDAHANIGEVKQHPNQKPTPLIAWCLSFIPDKRPILDSMMGSGTTGVAAVRLGRKFYGCEIDPTYFEIARKRIEAELNRFPLLEGVGTKETQHSLEFVE